MTTQPTYNTFKGKHYKEYQAWVNMLHRCHNPRNLSYRMYGLKGITVSDDWRHPTLGFANFLRDMGKRPEGDYSVERLDGTQGYCEANCVWADRKTQQNNLGQYIKGQLNFGLGMDHYSSPYISFKGRIQTLSEWGKELGIKGSTIRQRLLRGMSIAEAFSQVSYRSGSKPKMLSTLLLPPATPATV